MLFSARMRFSPETQSVRQTAIDRIIEQNLSLSDSETGLSVREIQEQRIVALPDGTAVFPRDELEAGLARLVAAGRVVADQRDPTETKYKVDDKVSAEIWQLQNSCEQRLAAVVGRLFRGAQRGASIHTKPFLECLCFIFSRLGEAYVRHIKHEISADELLNQPHVTRAFGKIKSSYPFVDQHHFQSAIVRFFADEDPEFAALKWNLAQNYFVAKCLGLDPSGRLLSRELFGEADLYLDTNVVIEALEPRAKHHPSFEVLAKACKDLNIKLHACQISIDELRKVIGYEREAIQKVADKIPDETAPKIKGVLFPIYYRQKKMGESPDLDALFEYFSEPTTMLRTFYDVEIVDDKWFIENASSPETDHLSEQIRKTYENRPWRHKSENAADHDALLLRWVRRDRETSETNAWIVTLDHSLPSFQSPSKQGNIPLAIRLDAILQWLSPIALDTGEGQDRAAAIFSEALKYNLLPQESFFELGDFLAFAEWEWDTKELPAEDVEGCIRCVRTAAPHLNPADPADREKISREFNKYLRDPGRKYKGEIARLEARSAEMVKEKDASIEQLSNQKRDLEAKVERDALQLAAIQSDLNLRTLKASALRRLLLLAALWAASEVGIGLLALRLGEGANNFQKVKNAWEFMALAFTCLIGACWVFVGHDRIRALGWPFTKLLADE